MLDHDSFKSLTIQTVRDMLKLLGKRGPDVYLTTAVKLVNVPPDT